MANTLGTAHGFADASQGVSQLNASRRQGRGVKLTLPTLMHDHLCLSPRHDPALEILIQPNSRQARFNLYRPIFQVQDKAARRRSCLAQSAQIACVKHDLAVQKTIGQHRFKMVMRFRISQKACRPSQAANTTDYIQDGIGNGGFIWQVCGFAEGQHIV